MGKLKQARAVLITMVLGSIALRITLWAVAPLLPYMVAGIIFISCFAFIFGIIWKRSSKL